MHNQHTLIRIRPILGKVNRSLPRAPADSVSDLTALDNNCSAWPHVTQRPAGKRVLDWRNFRPLYYSPRARHLRAHTTQVTQYDQRTMCLSSGYLLVRSDAPVIVALTLRGAVSRSRLRPDIFTTGGAAACL